jgi:hypothetical protein
MVSKGIRFVNVKNDMAFKLHVLKEKIEDKNNYLELCKKYNVPQGM